MGQRSTLLIVLTLLLVGLAAALAVLLLHPALPPAAVEELPPESTAEPIAEPEPEPEPRPLPPAKPLRLAPTSFDMLPGWGDDPMAEALPALAKSCNVLIARDSVARMGPRWAGHVGDWKPLCRAVLALPAGASADLIRYTLEALLQPHQLSVGDQADGIFTGYYEPLLRGSRVQSDIYTYPIYARPDDLIDVDLGLFRANLKGQRISGRLRGGRLQPYPARAAIDRGAISSTTDILYWVDDPVDAFFLHIQGSGRIRLDDGRLVAVGYAGQNGHAYVAVGRRLIQWQEVLREDMSMQAIRTWLRANPDRREKLLHENPSYIFFRDISDRGGAIGSAGVVLTPERSLAADLRYLPHHVPVFLSSSYPDPDTGQQALQQLMLVQDTGGAIRGGVRGDIFWGHGARAEQIAGKMNNAGRYYVLLPKGLAR